VPALGLGLEAGDGVGDQVVQGGLFEGELQNAGVYAGEFEEVVHEAAQVLELQAGGREVALPGLLVGGDAVGDGFDQGPRGGQGRAQIVRDGGYEVAAHLLHLALSRFLERPRHVVEVLGETCDLVVAFYRHLRLELAAGDAGRALPYPLYAACQRHRVEQAEAYREDRREGQHRQQEREVVSRDEHGPSTRQHHPEEQEAPDQTSPHELRPHGRN
jgi:hypothetical protein